MWNMFLRFEIRKKFRFFFVYSVHVQVIQEPVERINGSQRIESKIQVIFKYYLSTAVANCITSVISS